MKVKYIWKISSFCNDCAQGEANSVTEAIRNMAETPLLPEDWIQTVIVTEKGTDNNIIMAIRGNYNERFYQHGVAVVSELDDLINY